MRCRLHAQRRRSLISLVVFAAFVAAPAAAAEIVKCVAKDGSPLYQNFPCHIDSLGTLPSNPSVAKTRSTPDAAGQKPKSESIKAASNVKSIAASEPRVGMSVDEVRALLGEPEEAIEDEPPSGRVSIWRYANGTSVQFDHKQRVSGVQR